MVFRTTEVNVTNAHLHVFCLRSTIFVHPGLFLELWEIAIAMAKEQQTRTSVDRAHWTGEVTTAWREGMIGCIGGIIFDAKVEVGSQSGTVRFIVRDPSDQLAFETFRMALATGGVRATPSQDEYSHVMDVTPGEHAHAAGNQPN